MLADVGETVLCSMREFITARFGDARLRLRLAKVVASLLAFPDTSLPTGGPGTTVTSSA